MREPATLEEAQEYIGRTILKLFTYEDKEYKGTVQGIDTRVETDDRVEVGLFYRVVYDEDDDEEHMTWDQLSKWLANANNKLKEQGAGKGDALLAAEAHGSLDKADPGPPLPFDQHYAVNGQTIDRPQQHLDSLEPDVDVYTSPDQQQQKHQQQQQQQSDGSQPRADTTPDDHRHQQQQGEADSGQYGQLSNGSGGQALGGKRRRAEAHEQQQQQQQTEVEPGREASPVPVPAPAQGSAQKRPRKSGQPKPRTEAMFAWQQQAHKKQLQHAQARAEKQRREQAQATAAAAAADRVAAAPAAADPASVQEHRWEDPLGDASGDAVPGGGGDVHAAPQQQQQQQQGQQQYPASKKARVGDQQRLQVAEADADMRDDKPGEDQQGQQEMQRLLEELQQARQQMRAQEEELQRLRLQVQLQGPLHPRMQKGAQGRQEGLQLQARQHSHQDMHRQEEELQYEQANEEQLQQAQEGAHKKKQNCWSDWQAQAAAAAAAANLDRDQERQGEDAAARGDSDEYTAAQQQQEQGQGQGQHRPSKKARTGEQQMLHVAQPVADAGMECADLAEEQQQQDAQQELQELQRVQEGLQGLQEGLQGQEGQHEQHDLQLQGEQLSGRQEELQGQQSDLQGQGEEEEELQLQQVLLQSLQGQEGQLRQEQQEELHEQQSGLQVQGEEGQELQGQQELQEQQSDNTILISSDDEELQEEALGNGEGGVEQEHAAQEEEQARPKQFVVRQRGLAGHIKHVQAVNFMCHSNFVMDFGLHVHVIGGLNGSGKSVVLSAMQAALGAKVKDTGRGDDIKDLVKDGCNQASVKVTLWNTGEDAFQHDSYGDWITIERVIKTAGGTQYKIFSSTGRKVSEGFKNVAALLDYLNVDASNPLAVLTQGTAKDFHDDVGDQKKLELFMQATGLQDMYDRLARASGIVQEMREAFDMIKQDHDASKAKAENLKSKLQMLEQSGSLAEQHTLHQRAGLWAQVKKQQAHLDGIKHKLEVKAPEVRAKHEAALAAANMDLEEIRMKEEQELAAQAAEQDDTRAFTDAMTALAADLKRAKAATRDKQAAATELKSKLQQLQADMKNIMEAEHETGDDRQREYQERLQQHETEMSRAREALTAAEAQFTSCQEEREGMRTAVQDKEEEVSHLKNRVQSEQQTIARLRQELQQLQHANGQKLAMFGPHAALRELVDQKIRQFSKPPIGPVGAHLTLTDTKWAVAGEVVLGRALELWIVANARDNDVLRGMAKQVQGLKGKLDTLVTNFDRPPYIIPESKRLLPGWRNLRELIKIDPQAKVLIDNKLMDETRYELVVVHEDEEKCRDAMYDKAAGASVSKAVHISGLNFSRIRNDCIMVGRPYKKSAPRIGASIEEGITETQQLLQASQAHLLEAQEKLRVANMELQELRAQSNTRAVQEKQALSAKSRAAQKVQLLQSQAPILELDEADGEDMVADQLRQLRESLQDVQLRYDRVERELKAARVNEHSAKKLHEDRQAEMQQTLTQMNDRTEALDRLATQKEAASKAKAEAERKLQSVAQQVAKLQAGVATFQRNVDEYREAALKKCTEEQGWAALKKACDMLKPELETRSRKRLKEQWRHGEAAFDDEAGLEAAVQREVQDKIHQLYEAEDGGFGLFEGQAKRLERQMAEAEREAGGNKDELKLSIARAEKDHKDHIPDLINMNKVVRMCEVACDEQWRKYDMVFESELRTASDKFYRYMYRRGHMGWIRADEESRGLKVVVQMNAKAMGAEAKNNKKVKDLKQLSGGERSFTTVAFILALGERTESPFRAMDEYDVFMDAVNRRIATHTLLEFAMQNGHLQLVLLTPQDLNVFEDAQQQLAKNRGHDIPRGFLHYVRMQEPRVPGGCRRTHSNSRTRPGAPSH